MTTYTREQLASLYKNANPGVSDDVANQMAAIALAESSGNPGAVNRSSGATGLWQVMPSVWYRDPEFKRRFPNLKDAQTNARAAEYVRNKQGLKAWTTYTSGSWRKFFKKAAVIVSPLAGVAAPLVAEQGGNAVDATAGAVESAKDAATSWQDSVKSIGGFFVDLPKMLVRFQAVAGLALLATVLMVIGFVVLIQSTKTGKKVTRTAVKLL